MKDALNKFLDWFYGMFEPKPKKVVKHLNIGDGSIQIDSKRGGVVVKNISVSDLGISVSGNKIYGKSRIRVFANGHTVEVNERGKFVDGEKVED